MVEPVLKNEDMILNHLAFSFHHPPENAVGKEVKFSTFCNLENPLIFAVVFTVFFYKLGKC